MVRALIVRSLTGFGYKCVEAGNVEEALLVLRQQRHIDLVITDVVMPGTSGGDLGSLLADRYPDLPVLYTSGFADNDVVRRGLIDAGCPFLQKPFAPRELARKVREVLESACGAGVASAEGVGSKSSPGPVSGTTEPFPVNPYYVGVC